MSSAAEPTEPFPVAAWAQPSAADTPLAPRATAPHPSPMGFQNITAAQPPLRVASALEPVWTMSRKVPRSPPPEWCG